MTAGTVDLERDTAEPPDPARDRVHPGVATEPPRSQPGNEIRLAAERAGREWEQPETD
ncbi:hypothetical protein [Amycolatopsis coloradensis]|uniref:hypothetical protein n=1 Tax=Amycolatopsis coloradensis TaxID=76021 RepID=UPI001300FE22|nr:hypothetical protein [Amycolatopsis coloradensis]